MSLMRICKLPTLRTSTLAMPVSRMRASIRLGSAWLSWLLNQSGFPWSSRMRCANWAALDGMERLVRDSTLESSIARSLVASKASVKALPSLRPTAARHCRTALQLEWLRPGSLARPLGDVGSRITRGGGCSMP